MSQDIGDRCTHVSWVDLLSLRGVLAGWSGWAAGGLVVAGGVEGEFAEEFAGGGVDDADVEVVGEDEDVGSGVGSADADVVESAVDAEGDDAGVVDAVGAHAVVDLAGAVGGGVGLGRAV
jgi:hypothetical protein